uniref:Gustatory receptor n=1 Tax=Culex quinquefasciatus TaxID=7176 RepID=A0A1S4KKK6_CULQU
PVLLQFQLVKTVLFGVLPFRYDSTTGQFRLSRLRMLYCYVSALAMPAIRLMVSTQQYGKQFDSLRMIVSAIAELTDDIRVLVANVLLVYEWKCLNELYGVFRHCFTRLDISHVILWNPLALGFLIDVAFVIIMSLDLMLSPTLSPYMAFNVITYIFTVINNCCIVHIFYLVLYCFRFVLTKLTVKLEQELRSNFRRDKQIRKLSLIYYKLYRASVIINYVFGLPILCGMMQVFLTISGLLYFTLVNGLICGSFKTTETVSYLFGTIWNLLQLMQTAEALRMCSHIYEQLNSTSNLLHRFNPNGDLKLKRRIDMLQVQMMHNPIRFTACGMYTLDFSVLFLIVASVMSYLIILVQFEVANNCGQDSRNQVTDAGSMDLW